MIRRIGKEKSAFRFFVVLYALSLPWWTLQIFIGKKGLPLDIPVTDIGAAFMPLVAACLLLAREQGPQALRALLLRIFDYKHIRPRRWWLLFGLPLAIFIAIYLCLLMLGIPIPTWQPPIIILPLLLTFFFLGAVGEEVGYMGYAYEPLRKRWNEVWTALIIGLPWAVWHYPSILQQGRSWSWIVWGTIGTIAVRVLLVWVYRGTHASLFAVILVHALYNTGRVLFPKDGSSNPLVDYPAIHYGVLAVIAVAVVLLARRGLLRKLPLPSQL